MNECYKHSVFFFSLNLTEGTISVSVYAVRNISFSFHKVIICAMIGPQTTVGLTSASSHNEQQPEEFTFQQFSFTEHTLQMRCLKLAARNLHCIHLNKNTCIIKNKIKQSSTSLAILLLSLSLLFHCISAN